MSITVAVYGERIEICDALKHNDCRISLRLRVSGLFQEQRDEMWVCVPDTLAHRLCTVLPRSEDFKGDDQLPRSPMPQMTDGDLWGQSDAAMVRPAAQAAE